MSSLIWIKSLKGSNWHYLGYSILENPISTLMQRISQRAPHSVALLEHQLLICSQPVQAHPESQGEKEMTMLLSHQQKGSKLSVLAEYRNVIHFSKLNYRETTQRAFTVQPQWLPNICTHTTVTLKLLLFPRLVLE